MPVVQHPPAAVRMSTRAADALVGGASCPHPPAPRPASGRAAPRRACRAAAARGAVPPPEQLWAGERPPEQPLGPLFDALADELAAPGRLVTAGATPLGRGLIATAAAAPGQPLLRLPPSSLLCVADAPGRPGGNACGRRALAAWAAAHGGGAPLPPLLTNYLLGGQGGAADWFLRLCAWLLWLARHGGPAWRRYAALLPREAEMTCLMNFRPEASAAFERSLLRARRWRVELPRFGAGRRPPPSPPPPAAPPPPPPWPSSPLTPAPRPQPSHSRAPSAPRAQEVGELQSAPLEALAARERTQVLGVHELVFSPAGGELRGLRLGDDPDTTVWAACCVNSRCFSETAEAFALAALRPIAPGEEVTISYGYHAKSNDDLMRDAGFVLEGNPQDRIPFGGKRAAMSSLLAAAARGGGGGAGGAPGGLAPPHALDLRRLLAAARVPARAREGRLELPALPADADQGRRIATVLSLQQHIAQPAPAAGAGPGAAGAGAAAGGGGGGDAADAALARERRCVDELLQEARQLLASHPTSIAEDEVLLAAAAAAGGGARAAPPLAPRRRAAVASRLERKRLLAAAAEVLAAYATALQ
eukprot:scaffold2.g6938.t1